MANESAAVIIRRIKKVQHGGHHGGAWKVAYADFVTAMMAFFMVMWIVGISDKEKRAAISDYFNNPSAAEGHSPTAPSGMAGPGGASTSMIELGGGMDLYKEPPASEADVEAQARELDRKRLEALRQELMEAIDKSQALEPFKDQLLLDITAEGLRIQIVDKQNRPMFDLGGAQLKGYTAAILHELAGFIQQVPNRISLTGHTDITQFGNANGYTNWELSSDRANAARRALISGGMHEEKIARVVGLASTVLFDRTKPDNPINRRISIVVLSREAEAIQHQDVPHDEWKTQARPGTEAQGSSAFTAATEKAATAPKHLTTH